MARALSAGLPAHEALDVDEDGWRITMAIVEELEKVQQARDTRQAQLTAKYTVEGVARVLKKMVGK